MAQLTFGKKLAYSTGGFALNLANLAISQWLMKLYVPSKELALISPVLFSLIFLIGRLTDGITEPLIGYLSDNFRSKRGRRLPFIIFATLPVAVISFLLWTPPFPGHYHWLNGVYVFVMVQLFFISWSTLANPYMSLLPEFTSDLKERVNISTMQSVFLMLGTLVFGAMGAVKEKFGWMGIGAVLFFATIISFLPTIIFIRQPSSIKHAEAKEKFRMVTILLWAKTTFKNRPFVYLLTATSLFWFSLNMIILLVPFWSQYILGNTDDKVVMIMAPVLGANILFFFAFNILSKKFGKYLLFLVVLAGAAVCMPLLALVGKISIMTPMLQTQIVMGLIGVFMAGFIMLPFALLADVIDYDEVLTGKRREGIYFGVQAIFQKVSIGISISVAGLLMYLGARNTPSLGGLRMIPVAAGITALISFIIFLKYPLREKDGKIHLEK